MLAQHAAVDDVAEHIFAADTADAQFDQSVAEQDAGTSRELAAEIGKRGGNARGCARYILWRDGYHRTGFQQDGFVTLQWSGADFRALEVLEDADRASLAFSGAAQALDIVGVIFVGAVRKIEACDVHAKAEQVAHRDFGVAGGTDGADDFRAAGSRLDRGGIGDRFWLAGSQHISSIGACENRDYCRDVAC